MWTALNIKNSMLSMYGIWNAHVYMLKTIVHPGYKLMHRMYEIQQKYYHPALNN